MSNVDDLNDNCFVLATEFIAELCEAFEDEIGQKPSIDELCELLVWGLQSSSSDILKDINPFQVVALKPRLSGKGKIRPRPGDVIAIPAPGGGHFLVVHLGFFHSCFGDAFGIIRGRHKLKPIPPDWRPAVFRRPVCSGIRPLAAGRWKILANRPDLLPLFPPYPERYDAKAYYRDDPRIGPFGSAESPTHYEGERGREGVVDYSKGSEVCVLRHLTEEEAREIGLGGRDFYQNGLEEDLVDFLGRLDGEGGDV